MKCPKCGYQSFNFLSACKKCGHDLTQVQQRFRLGNPVLPRSCPSATTRPDPPPSNDPAVAAWPDEEESGEAAPAAPDGAQQPAHETCHDFEATAFPPNEEPMERDNVAWEASAAEQALTLDVPDEETLTPFEEQEPATQAGRKPVPAVAEEPSPPSETEPERADLVARDMPEEEDEDKLEQDLLRDEESDLDAWLLNDEEPTWRHKEPPARDQADPLRPALVTRLLAGLIDLTLLLGSFALFVLAGEYLRGGGRWAWPQATQLTHQAGPYFLVFFGLTFGYFTLFHYLTGQTPGKMTGRLVVTDLGGQPLQLSQAFLRSVGGLICLLPAGLGFCSILLDREGRGWNDRLAGSRLAVREK
jgi:uncharacterized RDD family membrane protein YckC